MSKPTPGPWTTTAARIVLGGDSHADIAIVAGDPEAPDCELLAQVYCRIQAGRCIDPAANAQVICAAPDLLAALEALVEAFDAGRFLSPDGPVLVQARAAVASARR